MLNREGVPLVDCRSFVQNHHFDLESYRHAIKYFGKSLPVEKRTLIRVEPIVVNPYQYQIGIEEKYGKIVVISPNELKSAKNLYWESGYIDFENLETFPNQSETGIAIINERKFSFIQGSNYKLRQRVIEEFLRNEQPIKLAGKNWNQTLTWDLKKQVFAALQGLKDNKGIVLSQFQFPLRVKSPWLEYAGRVSSARKFLSQSKFAIVIENDSTYVSEKLLNALIAGCIPLYEGPKLSDYGIPSKVAIEVGTSPAKFLHAVAAYSDCELKEVRETGQEWISSLEARKRWSVNEGFKRLIEIIKIRAS